MKQYYDADGDVIEGVLDDVIAMAFEVHEDDDSSIEAKLSMMTDYIVSILEVRATTPTSVGQPQTVEWYDVYAEIVSYIHKESKKGNKL